MRERKVFKYIGLANVIWGAIDRSAKKEDRELSDMVRILLKDALIRRDARLAPKPMRKANRKVKQKQSEKKEHAAA